jgi:tetratricopeptide (TPR) repeat protein
MNARTAQERFREADQLYRLKRYAEALEILDRLDAAFPNTRNVMLPRARCLRHLGLTTEAVRLCDQLIERDGDAEAFQLKQRILALGAAPASKGTTSGDPIVATDPLIPSLDITFENAPEPPPLPRSAARGKNAIVWVAAGLLLAVALVLALVLIL